MSKTHRYAVTVEWTGNTGKGTANYRAYERRHRMASAGKPDIPGSSDPAFRGDGARWNPEELLLAALSACHQLWYLHLCADAGIAVTAYTDHAEGEMDEPTAPGSSAASPCGRKWSWRPAAMRKRRRRSMRRRMKNASSPIPSISRYGTSRGSQSCRRGINQIFPSI